MWQTPTHHRAVTGRVMIFLVVAMILSAMILSAMIAAVVAPVRVLAMGALAIVAAGVKVIVGEGQMTNKHVCKLYVPLFS
jgi:hypothetical protein